MQVYVCDNDGLPNVIELTYFANTPNKYMGTIPDSLLDQSNRMKFSQFAFQFVSNNNSS